MGEDNEEGIKGGTYEAAWFMDADADDEGAACVIVVGENMVTGGCAGVGTCSCVSTEADAKG